MHPRRSFLRIKNDFHDSAVNYIGSCLVHENCFLKNLQSITKKEKILDSPKFPSALILKEWLVFTVFFIKEHFIYRDFEQPGKSGMQVQGMDHIFLSQ